MITEQQLTEKAGDAVTRALFDLGLPVSTKRTDSLHLGAAVIDAVRADIAAEAWDEGFRDAAATLVGPGGPGNPYRTPSPSTSAPATGRAEESR